MGMDSYTVGRQKDVTDKGIIVTVLMSGISM